MTFYWLMAGVWLIVAAATLLARHVIRKRVELAAFLEQGHREALHDIEYRPAQRLNAIQQRLSRRLGKRYAFSIKTRKRLAAELHRIEKHGRE